MKKNLILILVTLITLSGCSKKTPSHEEIELNEEKEEISYITGKYIVDGVMIEYTRLNRGDEITIFDEDDYYYYVNINNLVLAIDKIFVRTEKDKTFVEYKGYSKSNTNLYSDYQMTNKIETLSVNNDLEVIDEIADTLYVRYEGNYYFVDSNKVSRNKISTYVAPKQEVQTTPSQNNVTPTTPESVQEPVSEDNDISFDDLAYLINSRVSFLANGDLIKATVLKDDTPAYITITKRGDEVKIVEESKDTYSILLDEITVQVDKKYIRLDSQEDYKAKSGYTRSNIKVYEDFEQKTLLEKCSVNTEVEIIDEVDSIFVVKFENGDTGYTDKDNISDSKIVIKKVETKPVEESKPEVVTPNVPNEPQQPQPVQEPVSEYSEDHL